MPVSRYDSRHTFINDNDGYKKELFYDRDVKQIIQYDTAEINYPTLEEINTLSSTQLVWGATDKLYNIAQAYYQSPQYWWVIAWYNRKPTEAHFNVGDIYYVPQPLNKALDLYRKRKE
mgnify:FL=1|tara:strand:+ start:154 stop:507 length:354 start_codon:yes stop_codon:yes gene_type:complete